MGTPVTISNTVVKHCSGDNSSRKDSKMPTFFLWHNNISMNDVINKLNQLSSQKLLLLIEEFLHKFTSKNLINEFVLGLSGGIDSALCLALLHHFKYKCHVAIMPCENKDISDAVNVANFFNCKYDTFDLTQTYLNVVTLLKNSAGKINKSAAINIKPRLRMLTLYALAHQNSAAVVNTGNYSEYYLGYFTKYGDGAGDISLINLFYKSTIYRLAKHLSLPDFVINKAPSADLYPDQTDLKELKLSHYDAVEAYLNDKKVLASDQAIIKERHDNSAHKRHKIADLTTFFNPLDYQF